MLKDDVVSKKVAEEMQKAGVELEANWYHHKDYLLVFRINESMCICYLKKGNGWYQEKFYYDIVDDLIPTYTLDQTLRELPEWIQKGRIFYHRIQLAGCIRYENLRGKPSNRYENILKGSEFYHKSKTNKDLIHNPATACAKLLLWCKENGYKEVGG